MTDQARSSTNKSRPTSSLLGQFPHSGQSCGPSLQQTGVRTRQRYHSGLVGFPTTSSPLLSPLPGI